MNNFDVIYYINLDERPDRNEQILSELRRMNTDMSKVVRISATKHAIPAIGCAKSHMECYTRLKNSDSKNCLILEDDFMFKQSERLTEFMINRFFKLNVMWDVVMLSCFDRAVQQSTIPGLVRALNVQTASGYAVQKHFVDKLIETNRKGIELMEQTMTAVCEGCCDQSWKVLQPCSNWYIFNPKLGYQRPGYSNIEKRLVEYEDKKDTNTVYTYKYVLGVMTCKKNLPLSVRQYGRHFKGIETYPFIYMRFIGDPELPTEWSYNEQEHLLTLRCKDDYLTLPYKVYLFVKAVKALFPNIQGIFKTDDDITIDIEKLYTLIEMHKNELYVGKHVVGKEHISGYLASKEHVTQMYPEFKTYGVWMPEADYCAGGGYYLNNKVFDIVLKRTDLFRPFPENYKEYCNGRFFENVYVFEDKTVGIALGQAGIKPIGINIHDAVTWENM
jgi:GR25 family glycosyltransferase involved in LPS biosynthesis